jgi:hypothetical protein
VLGLFKNSLSKQYSLVCSGIKTAKTRYSDFCSFNSTASLLNFQERLLTPSLLGDINQLSRLEKREWLHPRRYKV